MTGSARKLLQSAGCAMKALTFTCWMRAIVLVLCSICVYFGSPAADARNQRRVNLQFASSSELSPSVRTSIGLEGVKSWKQAEIARLKALVSDLSDRDISLALKSEQNGQLRFLRCGTLSNLHKDILTAAETTPFGIIIPDIFFRQGQEGMQLTLVHELAHAADFGCFTSYSSEWMNYCARYLDDQKSVLALEESLAVCYSRFALGPIVPGNAKEFDSAVVKKLVAQDDSRTIEIKELLLVATRAYAEQDYVTAIQALESAKKINPKCPRVQYILTFCYAKISDRNLALRQCKDTLALLTELKFPLRSETRIGIVEKLILELVEWKHDYTTAEKHIQSLRKLLPHDVFVQKLEQTIRKMKAEHN